jgi:hypothetical protein
MARSIRRVRRLGVLAALLATVYSTALPGQTALTRQVMREKLARSQALLGALVTSDWVALARHSRALEEASHKAGWDVLHMPEYLVQTGAFRVAARSLITAADARDQPAALSAYTDVITSCVECHRYMARLRMAGGPAAPIGVPTMTTIVPDLGHPVPRDLRRR